MPCSTCAENTLHIYLERFNIKFHAHARAINALPILRASFLRPRFTQPILRSSSIHSLCVQRRVDSRKLPFGIGYVAPYVNKRGFQALDHNEEHSGLGAAGQQTKDLQERVSSIITISEQAPGRKSAVKKGSRSTPARLARRERRGPRRRFGGDRTRPGTKRASSSNAAQTVVEQRTLQAETTGQFAEKKALWAETVDEVHKKQPRPTNAAKSLRTKKPRWNRTVNPLPERSAGSAVPARMSREPNSLDKQPKHQKGLWETQKKALKEKFGEQGWMPRKRLSPDALDGIRTLHAQYPETYSTPVLAQHFKVSPEAIRRILKSKWKPNEEEEEKRKRRWEKRGENIWTEMSKQGIKPPKPWREKGIGRSSESEGRGHRRSFTALEEEIGTESDQGVITTRVGETRKPHKSLAHKIF